MRCPTTADHVHVGFYPLPSSGYVSPFVDAVRGRIDQGVDFVGSGPIKAIGKARILKIGAPGWPGGGGVLYRLLDGSHAGQVVFVYEGIAPTVHAGQLVLAGQQIGTFVPGSSTGIEIGFADSNGVPLSHATYHEGDVTKWGRRMAEFLSTIGTPGSLNDRFSQLLRPHQWNKVIKRLGQIPNPTVPASPSRFSLPATRKSTRASTAARARAETSRAPAIGCGHDDPRPAFPLRAARRSRTTRARRRPLPGAGRGEERQTVVVVQTLGAAPARRPSYPAPSPPGRAGPPVRGPPHAPHGDPRRAVGA